MSENNGNVLQYMQTSETANTFILIFEDTSLKEYSNGRPSSKGI